jgi:hypothetical protein
VRVEEIAGLCDLWKLTRGHSDVCVAVIDGTAELGHPAFQHSQLTSSKFWPSSQQPDTSPMGLHGTHVASLLFGSGPVQGICPDCRGYLIPLLPSVKRAVPQLDLARAIEEAVEMGAHIINLSAGQFDNSGVAEGWLQKAVQFCEERNVLLVAAAGNDGCDCLHVPACLPHCLAVGAMDELGQPLDFSNWGEAYLDNGLLAPGQDILGADPAGGTRLLSGTSFAAPIVSGIAALLLSLQLSKGQRPDPLRVKQALLDGAQRCHLENDDACRRWLVGKLDIAAAVAQLERVVPYSMPISSVDASVVEEPAPELVSASGLHMESSRPVFALGKVHYEFASETRRDSFLQLMREAASDGRRQAPNPYSGADMADYFRRHPSEAAGVIWTFNLEHAPIYALEPVGPYADAIFELLLEYLEIGSNLNRISLGGHLTSRCVTLINGQLLPVLEIRRPTGLWGWNLNQLVQQYTSLPEMAQRLRQFAERVYFDLSNSGQTSAERALNFTATNLFQAHQALQEAWDLKMELADIEVEPSPYTRKDCDGWDVILKFFDPEKGGRGRLIYRLSVDVSEEIPVSLGPIRSFRASA